MSEQAFPQVQKVLVYLGHMVNGEMHWGAEEVPFVQTDNFVQFDIPEPESPLPPGTELRLTRLP